MAHVTRAVFDALPVLLDARSTDDAANLMEAGDVMIHNSSKIWAAFADAHRASSHHVSMMFDKTTRVHALPDQGTIKAPVYTMSEMATVFRLKPAYLATFSGQAAARLDAMVGVAYSRGRAVASAGTATFYGLGAKARLAKYAGPQYNFRPKNVFCSELVVLAYQFAIGPTSPAFMRIDAKYVTPWDLEDYFLKHPTIWDLVGRVKGYSVN